MEERVQPPAGGKKPLSPKERSEKLGMVNQLKEMVIQPRVAPDDVPKSPMESFLMLIVPDGDRLRTQTRLKFQIDILDALLRRQAEEDALNSA